MAAHGGPNLVTDGLVLSFDPSNPKDNLGPNNIKNLADESDTYNAFRFYNSGTTTVDGITYNRTDLSYIDSDGNIVFDPKPPASDTSEFYSQGGNWYEVNYDVPWGTGDFTWIVWAYYNTLSGYYTLDWKARKGQRSPLGVTSAGNPYIQYRITISPFTTYGVTSDVSLYETNKWSFVCVRRESGIVKFFNGTETSSDLSFNQDFDVADNLGIGRGTDIDRHWRTINGKIGLIQIYNRALSNNEIKQNFTANRGRYGV